MPCSLFLGTIFTRYGRYVCSTQGSAFEELVWCCSILWVSRFFIPLHRYLQFLTPYHIVHGGNGVGFPFSLWTFVGGTSVPRSKERQTAWGLRWKTGRRRGREMIMMECFLLLAAGKQCNTMQLKRYTEGGSDLCLPTVNIQIGSDCFVPKPRHPCQDCRDWLSTHAPTYIQFE